MWSNTFISPRRCRHGDAAGRRQLGARDTWVRLLISCDQLGTKQPLSSSSGSTPEVPCLPRGSTFLSDMKTHDFPPGLSQGQPEGGKSPCCGLLCIPCVRRLGSPQSSALCPFHRSHPKASGSLYTEWQPGPPPCCLKGQLNSFACLNYHPASLPRGFLPISFASWVL